jgi:hypothetical protein
MSEVIEPVAETEVVETATETEVTEVPDHAAEAAKWKALSRKNEDRAKENEAAAKRLAEIEEANKSESEKLLSRAEAAETKLAEREAKEDAEKLVAEVSKEKGVPAAILRGATREELEEHADAYLASIPVIPAAPSSDGLGKVGSPIAPIAQITSLEELKSMPAEQVNEARRSGRLNTLLGKQN